MFPDTLGWTLNSNRAFTVSSFWKTLEGGHLGVSADLGLKWTGCFPLKVEVFVWQLIHGKILVKEVLSKCGGIV